MKIFTDSDKRIITREAEILIRTNVKGSESGFITLAEDGITHWFDVVNGRIRVQRERMVAIPVAVETPVIKVTTDFPKKLPILPKIPRHSKMITITEKIDGMMGVIQIVRHISGDRRKHEVHAGSHGRWLTAENSSFAAWVSDNLCSLVSDLGPGNHSGVWWGHNIGRGYGLEKGDRRFSLINVDRWKTAPFKTPKLSVVPIVCDRVDNSPANIQSAFFNIFGQSKVADYNDPAGILIFEHGTERISYMTTPWDPWF